MGEIQFHVNFAAPCCFSPLLSLAKQYVPAKAPAPAAHLLQINTNTNRKISWNSNIISNRKNSPSSCRCQTDPGLEPGSGLAHLNGQLWRFSVFVSRQSLHLDRAFFSPASPAPHHPLSMLRVRVKLKTNRNNVFLKMLQIELCSIRDTTDPGIMSVTL